jgi:DNA-binding XRE family transcriptional regulator
VEPDKLLRLIHSMIIDYRAEKGFGHNEFAKLAGLPNTALVPIEEEKLTEKGKLRTIDLMTLLKIFNGFPELKERILNYLSRNTEKKPTPAINTFIKMDITDLQRELAELKGILDQTDEERLKYMKLCAKLKVERDELALKNKTLRERLVKAGITDID